MSNAMVETTSKYRRALPPTRQPFFMSSIAGNPGDQGAEDNQGDDHGYQADEGVAERLHSNGSGRADVARMIAMPTPTKT